MPPPEVVFDEDGCVPYVAEGIKGLSGPFCLEFCIVFKYLKMSLIN